MNQDPRLSHRAGAPGARGGFGQPGLLTRIVAISVGSLVVGAAVVAAVMFSLIVLPIVLLAGAIGIGYLWFKTRPLRRQLDAQMREIRESLARQSGAGMPGAGATQRPNAGAGSAHPSRSDDVIDGDFIREAPDDSTRR